MTLDELINDWNGLPPKDDRIPLLNDETLRDGLQSPSVRDPDIAAKRDLTHRLARLGVDALDLGMPGAGPKALAAVRALMVEIRDHRLAIAPNVAVRTVEADLAQVAEIQQRAGMPLEAGAFLGSSPIRMDVEGWDLAFLVNTARKAVAFCRRHEVPVMMVTEDSTRARPDVLKAIYAAALDEGAQSICLSDTCGHATPDGTRRLVRFIKEEVVKDRSVRIDWHGHNDRGLGVANAIAAFEAGADRLHGSILGIGERCGNVAMDQLMINLHLMGFPKGDLSDLPALAERVAELCDVEIPANYPVLGRDAFRTGTGVHAAAIVKALHRGDVELADAVYSGVPAALVGRRQEIEIGPLAGHSNVVYWLEMNGYDPSPDRVDRILNAAKNSARILSEAEIRAVSESASR
ncbi:LeuA family protein [Geothrix sp. PMB-07]|uniref:LeuA family protein n=1 Tax=Geothrix sp. PMB-07 TaxID=3068640 RepID=UPI00274282A9|nr:LeuA family protein [Geothrix sp. PMB-07]WLT33434.1 LeuA family protein [Geothrix sp. PMB-07]